MSKFTPGASKFRPESPSRVETSRSSRCLVFLDRRLLPQGPSLSGRFCAPDRGGSRGLPAIESLYAGIFRLLLLLMIELIRAFGLPGSGDSTGSCHNPPYAKNSSRTDPLSPVEHRKCGGIPSFFIYVAPLASCGRATQASSQQQAWRPKSQNLRRAWMQTPRRHHRGQGRERW